MNAKLLRIGLLFLISAPASVVAQPTPMSSPVLALTDQMTVPIADQSPTVVHDAETLGAFSDLTRLTTQQLDRAIVELRQEMSTRLEADEKAAALAHEDLVRVPTTVDKAISGLRDFLDQKIDKLTEVTGEKFAGVNTQFVERDKRTEQLTIANSTAIAAALQAQKEAVNEQNRASSEAIDKSNKQTAEAIAQLQTLFQSNIGSLTTQLNDIKSRVDRTEGHTGGNEQTYIWIFAAIGAMGVLVSIVIAVMNIPHQNRAQP